MSSGSVQCWFALFAPSDFLWVLLVNVGFYCIGLFFLCYLVVLYSVDSAYCVGTVGLTLMCPCCDVVESVE